MENFSLYLSGGMEYNKNNGVGWRHEIRSSLDRLGYKVFDPSENNAEKIGNISIEEFNNLKITDIDSYKNIVRKSIIRHDYLDILNSDIVLVYYDESARRGAGTLSEVALSYVIGIPVIMVTSFDIKDIPGWLISETHRHFPTFEAAVEYLSNKEDISNLVSKCKKLARTDSVVVAIHDFMDELFSEVSNADRTGCGCSNSHCSDSGS